MSEDKKEQLKSFRTMGISFSLASAGCAEVLLQVRQPFYAAVAGGLALGYLGATIVYPVFLRAAEKEVRESEFHNPPGL